MSAKKGDIWKKPGRCFMCLVLEMTADSSSLQERGCNVWVWLKWLEKIESVFEV